MPNATADRFTAKILDALPLGLYVIDREFRVQAWNRRRETGTLAVPREDAVGRSLFEVLPAPSSGRLRRELDEVFRTGRMQVLDHPPAPAGGRRTVRVTAMPMRLDDDDVTHVITIGEDVTERRDAERRNAQAEKLAALGQLAAGVVHELNNPLATVAACAEAVRGKAGDAGRAVADGIEPYLATIEAEVRRCQRIVAGLLEFGRPRPAAKAPVPVQAALERALELLGHHDRFRGVTVRRAYAARLPDVFADAEQLVQVFLALLLNAVDAMDGGGTLTVGAAAAPGTGEEVAVAVSDTGGGILPEDLERIFEPFFTTKPHGRGTGLGLAIGRAIVAEHGGRIAVDSRAGRGSTFTVFLPADARPGR